MAHLTMQLEQHHEERPLLRRRKTLCLQNIHHLNQIWQPLQEPGPQVEQEAFYQQLEEAATHHLQEAVTHNLQEAEVGAVVVNQVPQEDQHLQWLNQYLL